MSCLWLYLNLWMVNGDWFWGCELWVEQHMSDYHGPITPVWPTNIAVSYYTCQYSSICTLYIKQYIVLTSSSNLYLLIVKSMRCHCIFYTFDQIFQLPTQFGQFSLLRLVHQNSRWIDKTKIQCKHKANDTQHIRILYNKQLQIECDCLNAIVAFQQLIFEHQI